MSAQCYESTACGFQHSAAVVFRNTFGNCFKKCISECLITSNSTAEIPLNCSTNIMSGVQDDPFQKDNKVIFIRFRKKEKYVTRLG